MDSQTSKISPALGANIRKEFPLFENAATEMAYLDSAASAQKPQDVINALTEYYSHQHANIHRGAYALSVGATHLYEESRKRVANFIRAKDNSIIFTRGTTEGVNLVAHSLEAYFKAGDTIVLSELEHHSNIVPWQLLAERKDLQVLFAKITEDGDLDYEHLEKLARDAKPKLFALSMLSNALGTVVDFQRVVKIAREQGALLLADAAQTIVHAPVDVTELDVDFLVFSGHKLYGPTGIGVLYVKSECYQHMAPFLGGGDMIKEVTTKGSTWADPPQKYEAGTPPIAEAVGLGAAVRFVEQFSWDSMIAHERELFEYAFEKLSSIEGVKVLGPGGDKQVSIISFTVEGVHPHDLATIADSCNVQIRAGHHCAMPLMKALDVVATARLSLALYSTKSDIDLLCEAVTKAQKMLVR